jgi:hypothetical protein
MIIGSAFTLFVVPSIYVLLARTHTADVAEEAPAPGGTTERLPLPVPVYQSAREAS